MHITSPPKDLATRRGKGRFPSILPARLKASTVVTKQKVFVVAKYRNFPRGKQTDTSVQWSISAEVAMMQHNPKGFDVEGAWCDTGRKVTLTLWW